MANQTPYEKFNVEGYQARGLKGIVSQIVDQEGWKFGNNISLILTKGENIEFKYPFFFAVESARGTAKEEFVPPASLVIKTTNDPSGQYTVKDELKHRVYGLDPNTDTTPTVSNLLKAAQYFDASPQLITGQCQSNHIILLSDGRPNELTDPVKNQVNTLTGNSQCQGNNHTACGRSIARYLKDKDFNTDVSGVNNVNLRTIGFALGEGDNGDEARRFLDDLAKVSNPTSGVLEANSAAELLARMEEHVQEIEDEQATFVTPGLAVNQFNSYRHENRLFYAMFQPDANVTWAGNIKPYQIARIDGKLRVADGRKPTSSGDSCWYGAI